MIYARVDVKLRDHERAHRAGAAMSTWLWALLYTREQELDGFVPDVAVRGAWVGEKEARRHAAHLVAVGLWEPTDGGWRICRYADKNETKASIAARREEARSRMKRARSQSVRANIERTSAELRESSSRAVPGSRSGSGSGIDQVPDRKGDRVPPPESRAAPIVELDEDLRAWAVAAGAPEPTRDHLESFLLNAREKGLVFADSRAAFKRWMIREKTFAAARRARGPDITRQPADPNAPWLTLPEVG